MKASISGLTTNSAIVEVATTRSCSGAPCAARTAAWASAPSTTICDAVASSLEPPAVSVIPAGPRLTQLVTEMLPEGRQRLRYGGLADAQRVRGSRHRAQASDQDESVELRESHDTVDYGAGRPAGPPRWSLPSTRS